MIVVWPRLQSEFDVLYNQKAKLPDLDEEGDLTTQSLVRKFPSANEKAGVPKLLSFAGLSPIIQKACFQVVCLTYA